MSEAEPGDASAGQRAAADGSASATRRALALSIVIIGALIVLAALVAGKAAAPGSSTFPPAGATTAPAGAAASATGIQVTEALAAAGIQSEPAKNPYRPAEAARLAAAPRLVIRAILQGDPDHGRIVIYEFLSPNEATDAATEQAAYVGGGVGRVQFTPDSRFEIRVVGSTVVFYAWSPSSSPGPAAGQVADALATLGQDIPIPN
jgi:hypothetical protein